MNQELDKLKTDHKSMHEQLEECQKKLQNLELLIGYDFGGESMNAYQTKNNSNF